jgi:hypothetical protein
MQSQEHIRFSGTDEWARHSFARFSIGNLEMADDISAPLCHSVGFRDQYRIALLQGRFREQFSDEKDALPAHAADNDLLHFNLVHELPFTA